jgi:hypothetical protein
VETNERIFCGLLILRLTENFGFNSQGFTSRFLIVETNEGVFCWLPNLLFAEYFGFLEQALTFRL